MEEDKLRKINWKYIPIKAHYFFLHGAMGAPEHYMQILAKDFGISPTAVGIIYTIVYLCTFLAKPLFGFITDKLQNIRSVLLPVVIITALSFFAVLYVPPVRDFKVVSIKLNALCKEQGNELMIFPPKYDFTCVEELADKDFECEIISHYCLKNKILNGNLNVTNKALDNKNVPLSFSFTLDKNYFYNQECECLKHNFLSLTCEPAFYKCQSFSQNALPEYEIYSFWIFAILAITGGTGVKTAFTLTDAACYEILIDNQREYGKQRLWATISSGMTTFISGFLNDMATKNWKYPNYSPGFYVMAAYVIVDIFILCSLRLEKIKLSTNICKDIGSIFSSLTTITFSVGIFTCGCFTGLLWTYEFWFLTDLGSSQFLLGLVTVVRCIVEVPFFFFSGWFIDKLGHFNCLIASLAAFALRIGLYSILKNPWLVLPIDILQGVTYAITWAAITRYAIDYAAPGTETTMLGIFCGIFEGLGVAAGSFLGGLGFDTFGGRRTFFIASMISLCCVPLLTIASKCLPKQKNVENVDCKSTIYSNSIPNYGSHDSIIRK